MDADAIVEPNYIAALLDHFRRTIPAPADPAGSAGSAGGPDGCSIYFEHPLSGEIFPPEVYEAITQYELHLRCYLWSVRSTGFPYAYHTVGSSFAVRVDVYCKEGGMNRRQGGEDFYFIQKIAQRGNYSECNETRVIPSPRPSGRVPFGTGPVVQRLLEQMTTPGDHSSDHIGNHSGSSPVYPGILTTYNPEPFVMLRQFFSGLEYLYTELTSHSSLSKALPEDLPSLLKEFLTDQNFPNALHEIMKNSSGFTSFKRRFWRWFNMFRIMKFLHFARERCFPDIPVGNASLMLLKRLDTAGIKLPGDGNELHGYDASLKELLLKYRKMDRYGA
jgi:hypothetical protein